jgi:hypothetical protein
LLISTTSLVFSPLASNNCLPSRPGKIEDASGKEVGYGVQCEEGLVSPRYAYGFLVDRTGKFLASLAITAVVLVAGGLAWCLPLAVDATIADE